MKKDTLNSSRWILGGVAALLFLGSGSLASAQVVTSYNDLAWGAGQLEGNTTKFTSPSGGSGLPSSGQLKDFATGNDTAVTLEVTGGNFNGSTHATQGANPTAGSDAFAIFDGNLDGLGAISYINDENDSLVLTFTSMDPTKFYDLAFFGHRGANGWDRASLVTISGQDSFSNNSSLATDNPDTGNFPGGVLFTGPTSPTTRLPADNLNGYVARFSNINPGSDGEVVLTISFGGSVPFTGKYGSAIRLVEVGASSATGVGSNPDLDGDGKADLVFRNTNTGEVFVWLGNGVDAPTTIGSIGGTTLEWTIAGFGDMDGDGKSDLVWRNTGTGDVAVWLGNGVNLVPVSDVSVIGGTELLWSIVDIRDMDGDGKSDLVWHKNTGEVAVWLGNGLNPPTAVGVVGGATLEWVLIP